MPGVLRVRVGGEWVDIGTTGPPGDGHVIVVEGFTQSAIDAAKVALPTTGGKLIFPPGTYTGYLTLDGYNDIAIEGYGARIISPTLTESVLRIRNCNRVRIEGLYLAQSGVTVRNSTGYGLRIDSSRNVSVEACNVGICASAGYILFNGDEVTISNCSAHDTLADGFHVSGGSRGVTIQGCHCYAVGDDSFACVSYQSGSLNEGISFIGNSTKLGKGRGVAVLGGKRIRIIGNEIEQTKWSGVMVGYDSAYATYGVQDCVVSGNTIFQPATNTPEAPKFGVEIVSSSASFPCDGVVVSGNTIREGPSHGVVITHAYCINTVVANNYIVDCAHIGVVALAGQNIQVTGNNVKRAGQQGVYIETPCAGAITLSNNVVEDANTSAGAGRDAYTLRAPGIDCTYNRVIDSTGNIERDFEFSSSGTDAYFWGNRTSSISGESLVVPTVSRHSRYLALTHGSTPPTTQQWKVGDIMLNTAPSVGGVIGWACTTAGTPGTWTPFGRVATSPEVYVNGFTQAAIDTAVAALPTTGGKLIFPAGTYTGKLSLDGYSNLTIEGYGALLSITDTSEKPVNIANGSFIRVMGLRVRHTAAPARVSGGNGFNLVALTDFVISGCHVTTVSSAGILMRGCERGTIVGNTVQDNWADGIHVTGISGTAISKDISIEGNHLYNTGDDAIAVVSYQTAPAAHEGITITGNTVRQGKARGISVLGGKRITITGNTVDETRASGILVCWDSAYSTYGVTDCVVEGNTVNKANTYFTPDTTKYGIEVASSSATYTVENVVVANNIVREAANRGIFVNGYVFQATVSANTVLSAGLSGISAAGAKNVQIAGNTIIKAARQGVLVESDVTGAILVAYNTVEDANEANVAATDAFQLRAAGIDCFHNRVIDNTGNIERDFEFSASGTDAFFWGNHPSVGESNLPPSASRFVRTLALTQGTAAPTTGTWKVGDIVFNTSVAAAGTIAWVCTTAGTPGTWTAWGFGSGAVTVLDTTELDFTLSGSQISAVLKVDSILATKLDPAIRTSLTKADNALPIAGGTVTGALTVNGLLSAGASLGLTGNLNLSGATVWPAGRTLIEADGSIVAYNSGAEAFVGDHGTGQYMGGQRLKVNAQTGTSYTLVAGDRAGLITRANVADSTQTLPADTTVMGIGSVIRTLNRGPGLVTHQAGAGSTVEGQLVQRAGTTSISVKIAPNTWHVSGAELAATLSDTAYGSSWDGVTGVAASKNAIYDIVQGLTWPIYRPAEALFTVLGAPTLSQAGSAWDDRVKQWLLDATAAEAVAGSFQVPPGVATINIKALVSPTSLAGTNVVLQTGYANRAIGTVLHQGTVTGALITHTLSTVNLATVAVTMASGVTVTPGNVFRFGIMRAATDGGDTSLVDVALMGVQFEWAS